MASHRLKPKMRRIGTKHPVVFYDAGHWFRSGHPNTYDRWLVLAPLTDYQRKLVTP